MATNYDIDYNDKRFKDVEADKKAALNEVDVTYGNMISGAKDYYDKQIDAVKDYGETQKKNQQQQTDFAIQKIEQQKEQAHTDYIKEQSGAYVDWQEQSNQYGVNAEKTAEAGLAGTGYSESSITNMYVAYQNRVATAREVYNRAVLNYDNSIKDAQLQNNAVLAEIAFNTLQKQLELSLDGFQYKNQLITEKLAQKRDVDKTYHTYYQDVLDQINKENALAEDVRQYDASLAEQKRQANLANERALKEIAISQAALKLDQDKFAYQKSQDAKAAQPKYKYAPKGQTKADTEKKQRATQEKKIAAAHKEVKGGTADSYLYLNSLIKSGANKDKVSNEIAIALREGAITKAEAQKLRNTFTPRGIQY